MKKEELPEDRAERQKVSKWPFLGAVLLYGANVDYLIIPFILKPFALSFWAMFWIAAPMADMEIIGGFYFWKWFAWKWLPTTEPVKDTVELTKSIVTLLREYGLLGTIIYKVRTTFGWATSPNRKLTKFVKAWGHVAMIGLGAESFVSGGRLVGTVLCASMKWKRGLVSLVIGNTIHVAISIWTWNLFFYFWSEYRGWFIVAIVTTVLFMVWRYFRKSPKIESETQ